MLLATAAWGVDNTLSRALAERDPGQVVLAKSLLGSVASVTLAVIFGEPLPSLSAAVALLLIGATGYGLSLRFYLLAQRAFGAARTARYSRSRLSLEPRWPSAWRPFAKRLHGAR